MKKIKRKVNVVFQIGRDNLSWDKTPIVYTLKDVDYDKDISDICHCLSVINNYASIRAARLFLNDEITPHIACQYNGIYFQANPNT